MSRQEKILVLAPHTDDGELGCGASIAKYIAAGKEVFYVAFSSCVQSLPDALPADTLIQECYNATTVLGIKKEQVLLLDFEVRKFTNSRQEILETMVALNKEHQPTIVLLPAKNDVHQDHETIYAEGIRAFKNCTLLGYELPWNNLQFQPQYFEQLEVQFLQKKITALQQYHSQQHRNYMKSEFIKSLATVRGMQSNTSFAEALEVYKMIKT